MKKFFVFLKCKKSIIFGVMAIVMLVGVAVFAGNLATHAGVILSVLIAPASLVYDGRKSIGGMTLTSNHYGSVGRARHKPKNPKTAAQMAVRASLSTSSKAWRALSQAIILSFNNLAKQLPHSNRVGVKYPLTGEAMFNRLNQNLNVLGNSPLTTCPDINASDVAPLLSMVVTVISGVITATWSETLAPSQCLQVKSSGIVSAGKTYNSYYKDFYASGGGTPSPVILTTQWVSKFGTAPVAGEVIFFAFRTIDNATGFASQQITLRVVAS